MTAKHKPTDATRKQVQDYAAIGTSQDDIAKVIGVSKNTLILHYRHELDTAMTKANGAVAGKLYSKCMDGNVTAMIFWLKTRARWRETDPLDLSDDDRIEKVEIVYKNGRKRK